MPNGHANVTSKVRWLQLCDRSKAEVGRQAISRARALDQWALEQLFIGRGRTWPRQPGARGRMCPLAPHLRGRANGFFTVRNDASKRGVDSRRLHASVMVGPRSATAFQRWETYTVGHQQTRRCVSANLADSRRPLSNFGDRASCEIEPVAELAAGPTKSEHCRRCLGEQERENHLGLASPRPGVSGRLHAQTGERVTRTNIRRTEQEALPPIALAIMQ